MARAIEIIAEKFRADYPTLTETTNGIPEPLSPDAYEARIQEMAEYTLENEVEQDEADSRIQLRRKYRAARTVLDEPVGTTAASVRQAVIQHRAILGGLLEILKDAALALDD